MSNSSDERASERDPPGEPGSQNGEPKGSEDEESVEALRRSVEEQYDFENFGPEEMARMSSEEWEAVFDPETWITGPELLDRAEADLEHRIARRDVFARVERVAEDRLVAYSDEGYAVVGADGSVEGMGTVLRDVKPTVALASMESYEVPDPPDGDLLPQPMAVPEGSGELGNTMVQVIAAVQVLVGLGLIAGGLLGQFAAAGVVTVVAGLAFLFIGVVLLLVVANARLSDRFRAEEYRNRLRAVGLDPDAPPEERPEFLQQLFEDYTELEASAADAGGSDDSASDGR
jgi:hypothetical protein